MKITTLLGLLLGMLLSMSLAQAGPATEYASASKTDQLQLLQQWSNAPDAARLPLLQALHDEVVVVDDNNQLFAERQGMLTPLEGDATPQGTPKKLFMNNRLRVRITTALAMHQLISTDRATRLNAANRLQNEATPEQQPFISQRWHDERDADVRASLALALANVQLTDSQPEIRLHAIQQLASANDPRLQARLEQFTQPQYEPDANVRAAAQEGLVQLQRHLRWGEWLGQAFSGISLASILLLAALGLAITYGLLGVINMAHGEMLMIGAYATWLVQSFFQQVMPSALAFYPLVALPVAFLITACIGMALERTVIRHLYGRPQETLLATWGISLILIQGVRVVFGTQNLEVANPGWLSGGWAVLPNLVLPYNRIAVILFAVGVLTLTWLLLNKTRLGMNVRAITQNRAMADCCGVPTGRVDMMAFGLGSGIAGLGGVALSQLGNVGPELGQGYIIDSFLVVVMGGVGQLAGAVTSALGLGVLNKVLEPHTGAVLGKIAILALVILVIQKRPQGLFAFKGRVID